MWYYCGFVYCLFIFVYCLIAGLAKTVLTLFLYRPSSDSSFHLVLGLLPYDCSFAILMYELYSGQSPFAGMTAEGIAYGVSYCYWMWDVGCSPY